jgi:hypothetical protein
MLLVLRYNYLFTFLRALSHRILSIAIANVGQQQVNLKLNFFIKINSIINYTCVSNSVQEVGCEDFDWTELAQDRYRW